MVSVTSSTSLNRRLTEQDRASETHYTVLARTLARAFSSMDFASSVRSSTGGISREAVYQDPKVDQANRQIGRLWTAAKFQAGWDGRDAEIPDADALKAAQDMITRITYTSVPIPMASVGCEGQSNLFWERDGFYADVDVTGQVVSYTIDEDGQDLSYEEPLIDGFIPPRLFQILLSRYEP